ncbi:PBECR2 nuclease fold domain-containing protein [uncultured Lamprocystis sp.]|uniref:PBECR2 nuclease fold domain-containing protein n=1 Tax=uncultured Lamprocystis sp. TaxID=543132 RepID=UPI0025D65B2A|nr:PBECR2 nuclease fold domain-containing protein [uncultured Lamprocystis sp.]
MIEAVGKSGGAMPEPRRLDLALLPPGRGERFYLDRFMSEFGEDHDGTALIDAPTGHRLAVSSLLFTDHKTGKTKIDKEGRAPYVPYIVKTIQEPDEIWMRAGHAGDLTLYLLARYLIGDKVTGIVTVFKAAGQVWEGWSGYQTTSMIYLESKRTQGLLYRDPKR